MHEGKHGLWRCEHLKYILEAEHINQFHVFLNSWSACIDFQYQQCEHGARWGTVYGTHLLIWEMPHSLLQISAVQSSFQLCSCAVCFGLFFSGWLCKFLLPFYWFCPILSYLISITASYTAWLLTSLWAGVQFVSHNISLWLCIGPLFYVCRCVCVGGVGC